MRTERTELTSLLTRFDPFDPFPLRIEESVIVPRQVATGRVIWPDGTRTKPGEHAGRFVQWEPTDLRWMIPLGGASWEHAPVVYGVTRRGQVQEFLLTEL